MAQKIHFKATKQGSAACAVGPSNAAGKVRKNRRTTYATIPLMAQGRKNFAQRRQKIAVLIVRHNLLNE